MERYRAALAQQEHHPILLIGLFALDLSVIHPFEDGNGRVARAITNALLADEGYGVVRYVSLEQLIADSADDYYRSLLGSTHGWHEGRHEVWSWLGYFVATLARAYALFEQKAAADRTPGSKQARVREYVLRHAPPIFRFADLRQGLPGIQRSDDPDSSGGIRGTKDLISADGVGRAAVWTCSSTKLLGRPRTRGGQ